mgnify:FL=1|tara:strand:+ start:551 stop:778 length:228 start_codon:yes stop_codon:yes gene_type:complete
MNNLDALRISRQRDAIYDWVVDRFRVQISENDINAAMALADEFFEWMDPDNLDNEQTFFYNENDLKQRYEELTRS